MKLGLVPGKSISPNRFLDSCKKMFREMGLPPQISSWCPLDLDAPNFRGQAKLLQDYCSSGEGRVAQGILDFEAVDGLQEEVEWFVLHPRTGANGWSHWGSLELPSIKTSEIPPGSDARSRRFGRDRDE